MGAALSCVNSTGGRQLLSAAQSGNFTAVQNVLEERPELASYTFFNNNFNIAHHAASKGHLDVLKALVDTLSQTASDVVGGGSGNWKEDTINALTWSRYLKDVLNARNAQGETPLIIACTEGHTECVAYLLEHGADVFAVDRQQRRSAVHVAAANGRAAVLKRLLDESTKVHTEEGLTALRDVRVHDMSGQCRYIDSRAENGMTALHLAAFVGQLGCIQALLNAGASMMVRTVDLEMPAAVSIPAGSTPLHLAAQRGNVAIVQAMLQAHADALGTLGRAEGATGAAARRGWEGDGRMDLRSVANSLRQLPYHVAWQRGYRQAAGILNPTVAIDHALENVRELDDGYGPQRLATLAAYALRINLLQWLEQYRLERKHERKLWQQREHVQKVIYNQREKEVRRFHSHASAEQLLQDWATQFASELDSGHLTAGGAAARPSPFSSGPAPDGPAPLTKPLDRSLLHGVDPESLGVSLSSERMSSPVNPMPTVTEAANESISRSTSEAVQSRSTSGRLNSTALESQPSIPLALPEEISISSQPAAEIAPRGIEAVRRPPKPPQPTAVVQSYKPAGHIEGMAAPMPYASPFECMPTACFNGSSAGSHDNDETTDDNDSTHAAAAVANAKDRQKRGVRFSFDAADPGREPAGEPAYVPPFRPYEPTNVSSGPYRMRSMPIPAAKREDSLSGGLTLQRAHSEGPITPPGKVSRTEQPQLIIAGAGLCSADDAGNVLSRLPSMSLIRSISSFRWGRQQSLKKADGSANLWRAASILGFEDMNAEDPECGICLDEPQEVGIKSCRHKLCLPCATRLCEVNKKPPLCPFCRAHITGFFTMPLEHHNVVL